MSQVATAVYAAGAVCWRLIDGRVHVLVVHRTVYGDVTIPKGKVDPGETLPETAMREIGEETGLKVALGVPLGVSRYPLASGREKIVHYWAAHVSSKAVQRSTFRPNAEIAALEWLTIKRARSRLSHDADREILDNFDELVEQGVTDTFGLIVLRHGKARARGAWKGSDATRPLTPRGVAQAAALVGMLAAWAPKKLVTSPAVRCAASVEPFAATSGVPVKHDDGISQDAWDAGRDDVRRVIGRRVGAGKTSVVCSHRPVLPEIMREIALATGTPLGSYVPDASGLEAGEFSVVHLSASNPSSGIIAIETHAPRA